MRALLVVFATCVAIVVAPGRSVAQENAQKEFTFDIARQALTPAIHEFSTQTGLNVGYFPQDEAEESIQVGPVQGTFTADAALRELLNPAGFAHEWLNGRSIYVFKRSLQPKGAANATHKPEASAPSHRERRWPGGRSTYDDIDFVIVIGTRISSLVTEPQSVAVMNQQKIDSYGVSSLGELFEYLPQIPFMRAEHSRGTGEQFADLRGFGAGTTMILINGRRVAGTATSFDYGGFDVNTIPLTAVQRVEVLMDASSVAIGTDTIAGMINVVLKDEITEPTVEVRYGAADGGAEERRLSAGIGTTREAFRVMATFDAFQRSPLLGAERELTRGQNYERFGGTDYRSFSANPGNVYSLTSEALPGLDSPSVAVPVGSAGIDLTPQDFTSTADLNRESLSRFFSIVPEVSRLSSVASLEWQLSPSFALFTEGFAANRKVELQWGPPTLSFATVPESNAFNPFGTSVAVDTLLEGARTRVWSTDSTLVRAVSGIRGEWNNWEGEISVSWMKDRAQFSRNNELDSSRVAEALASSSPDTALNVFRDGPAGTKALLASLAATPQTRRYSSSTAQGYARVERPLLAWQAGDIRLRFGGEWREEKISNFLMPDSARRTVSAAFSEIHAPLISPEMGIRAVRHLAVSIGARSDHYNDFGSSNTPQYGIVWRPSAELKFRASYSESYRPPLLLELYAPQSLFPLTLPDPRRGRQLSSVVVTHSGNRDLIPTAGRTWTTGVEFTPQVPSQLHLSAGYWRTSLAHRIVLPTIFSILEHEEFLPGLISREPPSPQDIESGTPGVLQGIDISWGNFGRLSAAGVDLNLSFTWDTSIGRFTPNLSAVWNDEFNTEFAKGARPEDRIGVASIYGTIPRWRAIASTAWSRGPLSAFVATQFVSAYDDAVDGIATERTIPATIVFDAQASLRIGELVSSMSFLSAVELAAGVKNVFDEQPHFAEAGYDYGYDDSQGDLRQRFWYLRLAKEF